MNIVIDTSVLIDHLRGGKVWKKIVDEIGGETGLFVPTIVLFELFSGESTKDLAVVEKIYGLLTNFQRIDLNEEISKQAGQLFCDAKKTLQVPDCIIAASALQVNATVLTLNQKHFEQIPGINVYHLLT